ncbi:MAG: cupin domain-containing protein [Clostridia bacterium]|nr:cupin domain-containing protein [Clostridia bacterium]
MKTKFTTETNQKVIEKLIQNPEIMINHFIFQKEEGLPVHQSNSNVYMIILKGHLSLSLDGKDEVYESGQILTIPYGLEMHVRNENEETLEMFVIKAPHPDYY